jgi:hypothetical protein
MQRLEKLVLLLPVDTVNLEGDISSLIMQNQANSLVNEAPLSIVEVEDWRNWSCNHQPNMD